jgi:hypothetical protein
MAEHLICNQEVVGSTPTAGSAARDLARALRSPAPILHRTECWAGLLPGNETLPDDTGAALRLRSAARPARSLQCAHRAGMRAHAGPCGHRRAAFGPATENRGRYPSGQRGQTVNLMAMPSAVRIRLSPPTAARAESRCARFPLIASLVRRALALGPPVPALPAPSSWPGDRGRSSMVELQPSKLIAWVRFPSPAPRSGSAALDRAPRRVAWIPFERRAPHPVTGLLSHRLGALDRLL